MKLKTATLTVGVFLLLLALGLPQARAFIHPGAPLTTDDLATLKAHLGSEPWKSGYTALAADGHSQLSYVMRGPFARVSRQGSYDVYLNAWRSDMIAIWNLSRMGYFTGNAAYSQKAHDILLAWAKTQIEFSGRESMLDLGDYAYRFVGGADILRGTWPGWTDADTTVVKAYFGNVLLPATNPYGESQYGAANKGALALVAGGLLAIFDDDTAKLDTIVYQVRTLAHIGLRNSDDIGLLGDSLRDQGHAHGQLFSLAMLAEALWTQGIDIYSEYNNRLLTAGEYFARVNDLIPTPFLPFGTTDAYYIADNTNRGWGGGNVMLNLIHGAYVVRKGLPAPYTVARRLEMPVDGDSFMFCKVADSSVATPAAALPFPTTTSTTSGLTDVDIGGAAPAGNAGYAGGTWTVQGGGSEMWGTTNDSCHFAYVAITGDCAIVAKVESVQNTSLSAKAGVMMRTSLSQGAPRAWMAVTPRIQFEQNIQGLAVYGGTNYSNRAYNIASSSPSYWVKLERMGNIITGYVSPDGTNWAATDVGRLDNAPATLDVGLVVCSLANGTLNTSTFSHVQITGGDGAAPAVTPAAPAALLAAPGEYVVPLRWQASFGATSYTVQRTTSSGGPYSIVRSGITASSYEDWTVTNGTTYYYVVTASNSAGTSANSPETVVTPALSMVNVATGGTTLASMNSGSGNEGSDGAFDGNPGSKWFGASAPTGWIQYDLGPGNAKVVRRYSITSANDMPTRDPKNWNFYGSQDGVGWTLLDSRSNETFVTRYRLKTYDIANTTAYRFYQLEITANNGATGVQLSELGLWSDKSPVIVVLSGLAPTYDGTPKPASATVTPTNLPVVIRYDGSTTPPTNAGTYTVLAFVNDAQYAGSASGTLTIAKATAPVALGALTFTYDGTPKSTSATTVPAGLAVNLTYGGSATPPIDAGSYTVVATVNDANYAGSATGVLTIAKAPAGIAFSPLAQAYDGTPKGVTATTSPPNLSVTVTYDGAAATPIYPGDHLVVATVDDRNYMGTRIDTLTIGITALVRHAPTIGGILDGSMQVLSTENVSLNGNESLSGDLLVPGSPALVTNGQPTIAGTREGPGALTPTNYAVTLNGGSVLRYLVHGVDAIPLPVVEPPSVPNGSRSVTLNNSHQGVADFATLRDLTLNGNAGAVAIPAGTYGSFTASGNSSFVLGVPGATPPAIYQLQNLTLNGNATLQVVGPVILTLANSVEFNSTIGNADHLHWLVLRIASGGVTLNGTAAVHGTVIAPTGTVIVNGAAVLQGEVTADRLTINGNAVLEDVAP